MMHAEHNDEEEAVALVDLCTLRPNEKNPRTIRGEAMQRLRDSIERDPQFMALRPIIIDENRIILGGNQRHAACLSLGKTLVPATWVRSAHGLTQEQRARFVLIDNAPDDMSGDWDYEILQGDYDIPLLESLGFTFPEYTNIEERNKEWAEAGMPKHEHNKIAVYREIVMKFPDEDAVQKFAKLVKRKVTPQTQYLWYPKQDFDSVGRDIEIVVADILEDEDEEEEV